MGWKLNSKCQGLLLSTPHSDTYYLHWTLFAYMCFSIILYSPTTCFLKLSLGTGVWLSDRALARLQHWKWKNNRKSTYHPQMKTQLHSNSTSVQPFSLFFTYHLLRAHYMLWLRSKSFNISSYFWNFWWVCQKIIILGAKPAYVFSHFSFDSKFMNYTVFKIIKITWKLIPRKRSVYYW